MPPTKPILMHNAGENMADDYLSQGIAAVKAGNKQEARHLLDAAIRAAPNDERTWGWFFNVCENDNERLRCLKEVLRINPNNESAKKKFDELTGLGFQASPAATKAMQTAEANNSMSPRRGGDKKGSISTLEWIIVSVVGGAAVLTIIGVGILFLYRNVIAPTTQIPTPLALPTAQ